MPQTADPPDTTGSGPFEPLPSDRLILSVPSTAQVRVDTAIPERLNHRTCFPVFGDAPDLHSFRAWAQGRGHGDMIPVMFGRIGAGVVAIALLGQYSVMGQSLSLQQSLEPTLKDKVLTFKVFSKEDRLQYDSDGNLKKRGEIGSWTIYSRMLVRRVAVKQKRVTLSGVRIVHFRQKGRQGLTAALSDMNVDLEIDIPDGAVAADVHAIIRKIVVGPEDLVPYVPEYWRMYLSGKHPEPVTLQDNHTVRVGGQVQQAMIVTQPHPKYPEEARQFRLEGTVLLEVVINETGDVEHINIVEPAGAGLDDNAVDAVSQWKYKPTTVDGKPVSVVTTVTVNFAIQK